MWGILHDLINICDHICITYIKDIYAIPYMHVYDISYMHSCENKITEHTLDKIHNIKIIIWTNYR